MEEKERFNEQKAPQKNTDHAFVKVGEDGQPKMPENDQQNVSSDNEDEIKGQDSVTTIQHR